LGGGDYEIVKMINSEAKIATKDLGG